VTVPNGSAPPGERPIPTDHGDGLLWTELPLTDGEIRAGPASLHLAGHVREDGAIDVKMPWWRGSRAMGTLTVRGERLDAPAPPLGSFVPDGYGDVGFQAASAIFPTAGCWQITGSAGGASLTVVVRVVTVG
jgi:hypothetical protein